MAIWGAEGSEREATTERLRLGEDHRAGVVLSRKRFWGAEAGERDSDLPGGGMAPGRPGADFEVFLEPLIKSG